MYESKYKHKHADRRAKMFPEKKIIYRTETVAPHAYFGLQGEHHMEQRRQQQLASLSQQANRSYQAQNSLLGGLGSVFAKPF